MATYSAGISVTFAGIPFAEVTDLQWSFGGSLPKGRSFAWTDDVGSVTLTCMSAAGVSSSYYGTRGDISITGGGATLTCKALYEGLSVAYELNGVTRYTVTFRLLDG